MAAPTAAATPHVPDGIVIENGHPTVITLEIDDAIAFWEVDVTPPGIDGGDANDLTNMHNEEWRTFAARTLKTLTESSTTVQVAPEAFTQIRDVVNEETTVTVHMPGGAKLAFYGYLRVWAPAAWVEGEPPQGTITIQPTNRDPETGTEEGPVLVLPSSGMMMAGRRLKRNSARAGKSVDVGPSGRVKRSPKKSGKTAKAKQTEELVGAS